MIWGIIIAGLALLWGEMLYPGKQIGKENGEPLYEGGGMLKAIGREMSKWKLGKPMGLCPVCSGFWGSLLYVTIAHPEIKCALLTIALSHIIIRLILK